MRSWTLLLVVWLLAGVTSAVAEDGTPGTSDGPDALAESGFELDSDPAAGAAGVPPVDALAADPVEPTARVADPIAEVGEPLAEAAAELPTAADPGDDLMLLDEAEPVADESAAAEVATDDVAWDGAEPSPATPAANDVPDTAYGRAAGLGPEAVDEHGHRGRIHTVITGDTLWDISSAYLGTPWVWPSVWQDNDDIENPHLILPDDRIWITAGEMRKVTREEADRMIAADAMADAEPMPVEVIEPAAPDWDPTADEAGLMADDMPAAMDQLPLTTPLAPAAGASTGRTVRVAEREAMGFVSSNAVEAATSIVGSPSARSWLVDGDLVYLGMGDGSVEVGDEFTVFRDAEPVKDLDDGRLLGYHVDILGWMVVREIDGDSSIAEIRMSHSEISRGDRVIPRTVPPPVVSVRATPEGIDGKIVFMPSLRTHMGSGDHVYLNRGALHGFEVGSAIEVYKSGRLRKDRVTGDRVMTPDRIDAQLVLVEVKADTSVAFVTHASRELEIGDTVRPLAERVASR